MPDKQHQNLWKKIDSGMDQLSAQYSETSETSQHSGSEVNAERMRYQANLCVATFPALFLLLKDYYEIILILFIFVPFVPA